jgi:hypothetical protein
MSTSKTIVLVHGGFVDGSGWQGVYQILKKDGFDVIVAQNPTLSLADDVAVRETSFSLATPTAELSYRRRAMIRRSSRWSTSRPLRRTRASRSHR